ncbi:MAG: GntR family transcriptional regulator [Desulfitobacteriia bacterium]|jgi:GntR family transcriptional regulator
MDIIISNVSGEPIYQQIIDQVKMLIISGEVAEGEALPSIRQLAKDLRISVITTKRAYEELEREGFIRSVPGKGSFVAPYNRELIRENQLKIIEEKLSAVIAESKKLNLSLEEVMEILRYLYLEET